MEKQGLLAAVRDELISRARRYSRSEAPISNSELADRMGMPPFDKSQRAPYKEHPLHDILRQLDVEDTEQERPFLSCLVVHASGDRIPGNGFFTTIAEFRRLSNPIPKSQWQSYWTAEMDRLFNFYQGAKPRESK